MANPFDRPDGPPPDFVESGAGGLAEVIPLRPRARTTARAAGESPAGLQRGAHPAGRKLDTAASPLVDPGDRAESGSTGARSSRKAVPRNQEDHEPDPHEVARAIVLKALTGAPRSRRQLADKLAQRGCDPEVAETVLDRLQEVGLVDDHQFAETYVRSRQASRGLGSRGLAAELRRKGVDDETIREVLDDVDTDAERERAEQLVAKKLRSMHGLDATVQTRRLAGMLARKGYPSSMAWSVIREAIAEAPEHQPD